MDYSPVSRTDMWPQRVFVAPDALNDPLTERVLSRLKGAEIVHVKSADDPLSETSILSELGGRDGLLSEAERISLGKTWLLLTRFKGKWLKRCPGTRKHVCCNLLVASPAEGCPLDCTYCALQQYFRRNPTLKLFSNVGDMCEEIKGKVEKEPHRFFRICTGELTDSLAWDPLTDLSLELVPFFARLPNALLELKTKTRFIENLLSLKSEHRGKTVVSWSVNASEVAQSDEAWAATIEDRIDAASKVTQAGYRVGFHFDPLVHYEGWEEGYRQTIRRIFTAVDPREVAWVSIAPLRYHPEQQRLMIERFPASKLPFGEHFLASDTKLRMFQPIRFRMLRFVWSELKKVSRELPVYMCMESAAAWRSIAGTVPAADELLTEVYSRRGCENAVGPVSCCNM